MPASPTSGRDVKQFIEDGSINHIELDGGRFEIPNPVRWSGSRTTLTGNPDSRIIRQDPNSPLFVFRGPRKQFRNKIENVRFFDAGTGSAPLMHNLGSDGSIMEFFTVRDCEFREIGNNGVFLFNNITRALFERCKFKKCQGDVMHLRRCADPHVKGCVFEQKGGGFSHSGVACKFVAEGEPRENGGARIQDSVIMRADRPLWWEGVWQTGIQNVVFDGMDNPPLLLNTGTSKISDVSATGWRGSHCFTIVGAANHKLTNCRFQYANGDFDGLRVIKARDVKVSNSSAKYCARGFNFRGCKDVSLNGCTGAHNEGAGVVTGDTGDGRNSAAVIISDSQFYRNGFAGVNVSGSSDTIDVLDNQMHHNDNGVYVGDSTENIRVEGNTLYNNSLPIRWPSGGPAGESFRRDNRASASVAAAPARGHVGDPEDPLYNTGADISHAPVAHAAVRQSGPVANQPAGGGGNCQEEISAAQSFASDLGCAGVTSVLECPYDQSVTYTAKDACEEGYLVDKGWTIIDSDRGGNGDTGDGPSEPGEGGFSRNQLLAVGAALAGGAYVATRR